MDLKVSDNASQGFGRQFGIVFHLLLKPGFGQHLFEEVVRDAHDHAAEHLNQAAIGVVDKARVAGQIDHALDGLIVEADIEHGVHHAGHGKFGAAAAGDQQRVGRVPEDFAAGLFHGL